MATAAAAIYTPLFLSKRRRRLRLSKKRWGSRWPPYRPLTQGKPYDATTTQQHTDVLYSLDATAHLATVTRRSLLVYCRARLVQPMLLPPFGMMAFTAEAIYIVRRVEHLRADHRCELAWLNTVCDLLNEVEYLRAEVRFLRNA